jgi:molecular chaperone DnaK
MNGADYCFGIDLGTSNSSICYVNPKGRHRLPYVHVEAVRIPRDKAGDYSHRLPSVLYSTGKLVSAGFEAQSKWKKGRLWETLFPSAKSELGAHRFYDEAVNEKLDTPVKVQAEILRRLVSAAKDRTGEDPRKSKVVITVPASFEMGQRKDTLGAAKLAGLNLGDSDLLDEPNAAFLDLVNSQAIDRLDLSSPKNILVFDFGGGTCDISILRVQRDEKNAPLALLIENLAISNYARLGGDNLDLLLVHKVMLPKVCTESGVQFESLSERDKRDLRWSLKETACRLKERLCEKAQGERQKSKFANPKQTWTVEAFTLSDAGVATKKIKGELAYFEFENLLEPFVGRLTDSRITLADGYYMGSIFAPVLESLDKARLNPDQIDAVLLNGASCRNPLVVRAFREFDTFRNAEILDQGDLDLAVARGAAVRCFYKNYQNYDPITPIVSAELGLITYGDKYETLVKAGTRLPFPPKGEFKRFTDRFWVPKEKMSKIHLPIYTGKEGNRHLVQTMSLEVPKDAMRGDLVVVELMIDLNKIMRFRAFLAEHTSVALDVTLENPLATRSLSPEQREALAERKRISVKRLENPLYKPSVEELIRLANLERLADEPERALEILQRLQARQKKQNETQTKSEWRQLNYPSFLKAEQEALNTLFPEGVPQPTQSPPPRLLPASGHNILGLCYGALARRNLSYEHYRQASEMEPAVSTYAANCGFALIQLGRAEEAVPFLKRAVTADPADGYAYVILGDALRQLGREEEAMKEFQEGKKRLEIQLRASPHNTHLLSWAEGVCQRLSEYEEMATFSRRRKESVSIAYLGASTDELVAGMDSGIIRPGELSE